MSDYVRKKTSGLFAKLVGSEERRDVAGAVAAVDTLIASVIEDCAREADAEPERCLATVCYEAHDGYNRHTAAARILALLEKR